MQKSHHGQELAMLTQPKATGDTFSTGTSHRSKPWSSLFRIKTWVKHGSGATRWSPSTHGYSGRFSRTKPSEDTRFLSMERSMEALPFSTMSNHRLLVEPQRNPTASGSGAQGLVQVGQDHPVHGGPWGTACGYLQEWRLHHLSEQPEGTGGTWGVLITWMMGHWFADDTKLGASGNAGGG